MTGRSKQTEAVVEQSIEDLQKRYQALNTRKIQAETSLEHARSQLESLKRQALELYGTADVAELTKKLEALKAENNQKRRSYQADLDRLESDLAGIEERFASAQQSGEFEESSS